MIKLNGIDSITMTTKLLQGNDYDVWKCLEAVADALEQIYLETRIYLGFLTRDDFEARVIVYDNAQTRREFWLEVEATLNEVAEYHGYKLGAV